MTYEEWEVNVLAEIKTEPVWKFAGYRKALFLNDLAWIDTDAWLKDPRGRANADQLVRSIGSVSANVEEGYGRGYGKQLLQFYTYALASAEKAKAGIFEVADYSKQMWLPIAFTSAMKLSPCSLTNSLASAAASLRIADLLSC